MSKNSFSHEEAHLFVNPISLSPFILQGLTKYSLNRLTFCGRQTVMQNLLTAFQKELTFYRYTKFQKIGQTTFNETNSITC